MFPTVDTHESRCKTRLPDSRRQDLIHFVLHDPHDTVAVVVVEGVKAGAELTGWVMDEDRMVNLVAKQDIPIGHKIAFKDMGEGDTVVMYVFVMGRVVAPIAAGRRARGRGGGAGGWG